MVCRVFKDQCHSKRQAFQSLSADVKTEGLFSEKIENYTIFFLTLPYPGEQYCPLGPGYFIESVILIIFDIELCRLKVLKKLKILSINSLKQVVWNFHI